MKKLYILIIAVCVSFTLFGQVTPTIWYFGNLVGLKFNPDGTTSTQGGNHIYFNDEGCTIVDDNYGKVVFYASGFALHDVNGKIKDLPGDHSSTQSPVAVQIPGVENVNGSSVYKFLLFIVQSVEQGMYYNGANFYVCLVKVIATGTPPAVTYQVQAGDVDLVNTTRMAEKLATCRDDQDGSWLVTHDFSFYQNIVANHFYVYHINQDYFYVNTTQEAINELSTHAQIQTLGTDYATLNLEAAQGQIKFNTDRNKLGLTIAGLFKFEVYNFDNSTGSLGTEPMLSYAMPNSYGYWYGCEFSRTGNFFYTTEGQTRWETWHTRYIYQWDISTGTLVLPPYVVASGSDDRYQWCALQLGPNNKIYGTHKTNNPRISLINAPDIGGYACGWSQDNVPLGGPGYAIWGLPTYIYLENGTPVPPPPCYCNLSTTAGGITNINKPAGTATVTLTLNSGSIVAKTVFLDLVNFNISASGDCKKYYNNMNIGNMGMFASPVPQVNGLPGFLGTWQNGNPVDYSHEIVWDLTTAQGVITNQTVTLNLQFPFMSDLPCCPAQYFVGFRVSYMDDNCNTCQEMVYAQSDVVDNPLGNKGADMKKIPSQTDQATGYDESPPVNKDKASFSVYPNPNDGTFTISTSHLGPDLPYTIYDQMGNQVNTGILNGESQKISISPLSSGIYLVKVTKGSANYFQKVIVN